MSSVNGLSDFFFLGMDERLAGQSAIDAIQKVVYALTVFQITAVVTVAHLGQECTHVLGEMW